MSIACKPIIPVGVLSDKNKPTAIDFDILSSSFENPILRYEDKQMRLLTVLTNSILEIAKSSNILSDYPDLSNRYKKNPISKEELAEIISETGMTPDYVENSYEEDFPIDIDLKAVNEAINEIKDSLKESLDQIRTDNQSSSIPLPTEDDIERNQLNPSLIPTEGVIDWEPQESIKNIFRQMNSFYSDSYTNSFRSRNKCSSLSDPFNQLSSLIANSTNLIRQGMNITSSLTQLVSQTISRYFNFPEYIMQISILSGNLNQMKDDLLSVVDNLVSDMKLKVESIKRSVSSLLGGSGTPKASIRFMTKKIRQVETFLSDQNISQMKDKVKSVIASNETQFEDLLPSVLELLSLKVCGVTSYLETIIQRPINELNRLMNTLSINHNILENYSILKTNRVLDAGGIRLGSDLKEQQRLSQANTVNRINRSNYSAGTDLIPSKSIKLHMTPDEIEFVNNITRDYDEYFRFESSVKNMGLESRRHYEQNGSNSPNWSPTENTDDSGWKVVAENHPYIYAALARISKRLRDEGLLIDPLIINSAYRSRYYNREVISGGAFHSFHMQGMALDIGDKASGLTALGSSKFIDFASEEGFTRFGIYSSFIHIDISDGGPSVFRQNRSNSGVLSAIERHKHRRSRS